jgi:hypothetical protein
MLILIIEKVSYTGKDYDKEAYIHNQGKREPKIMPIKLAEAESFVIELRTDDHLVLPGETFVEGGQTQKGGDAGETFKKSDFGTVGKLSLDSRDELDEA